MYDNMHINKLKSDIMCAPNGSFINFFCAKIKGYFSNLARTVLSRILYCTQNRCISMTTNC